jgi:uncharacterized membrane protein HdeD (DUF308 family)
MRRIVVRRVIGLALLLMGLGTTITSLGDRADATTDYARTATTIDLVVGIAFLALGARLAFRRSKRDQAAAERGQDQQGPT